jgi:hypothetical protein
VFTLCAVSRAIRHPNPFSDFWRDFNTERRWNFPELPPSEILRLLDCPLYHIDHEEFVRAKWMWGRRPASFLGDSLVGYLVAILIGFLLLLVPYVGILFAIFWFSGTLLLIANDVVSLVRWRCQYESSIARVVRSRIKSR